MVNTYKLKLTLLQQDILRLMMLKAGSLMNQRQIARNLNVSAPAILKSMPYLEENNLINVKQDKESKRWSIDLNRSNHHVMQLKRVDNLKQIYESGLADYLEIEFAGATIILFGSYSRGEDIINSDIDIAVIGRKDKTIDFSKYEKTLERKINVIFYDSLNKIHKNLKENICNGIVLYGGLEL